MTGISDWALCPRIIFFPCSRHNEFAREEHNAEREALATKPFHEKAGECQVRFSFLTS
jgi:hypothetical protein